MKVLIIGFGNMGRAIGQALAKSRGFKVFACDSNRNKIKGVVGVSGAVLDDVKKYDIIILSVKPQDILTLAGQIGGKISQRSILISIAAGVPIKKLTLVFHHRKIIRMMPNLGVIVGQGIAAWKAVGLSSRDKKLVRRILDAFTAHFEVRDENLIDAVTAISGSGPAYFFLFAEFLAASAKKLGLTAEQSRLLATKTLSAAAKLSENGNYQELINQVASKKGTTEAALKVFNKRHLDKIIGQAVQAAFKRAGELSR